jgi:dUTP pyrophosphatase
VEDYFDIPTAENRYVLGLLASDGHISKYRSGRQIHFYIHKSDVELTKKIAQIFNRPLRETKNAIGFEIYNTKLAEKIRLLLDLRDDIQKSYHLKIPEGELYFYDFLRGVIDGDGYINNPYNSDSRPVVTICSGCRGFLEQIKELVGLHACLLEKNSTQFHLTYKGINAQTLLHRCYKDSTLYLERKYRLYELWSVWIQGLSGYSTSLRIPQAKFKKVRKDAVLPYKNTPTDSGFDLTIIGLEKRIGDVLLCNTGLSVECDQGWYFDLVARSSIIKSGYMLANNVGIIDRSYRGEILVPLIQIDHNVPELQFPVTLTQLIPRMTIAMNVLEVSELDDTERNDKGFGSTERKGDKR